MKFLLLSIFFALPGFAADPVLEEIKTNLEEAKKRIDITKKQISELDENDVRLKDNLDGLQKNLQKKTTEQKEAQIALADYSKKIQGTETAKKEFQRNRLQDQQELELVNKDILATEKKLASLQAAKKALAKSIEVADDNLDKIEDSSAGWQKNHKQLQTELAEIDKDVATVKEKLAEQEKLKIENQIAQGKWRKSLGTQEALWQKLEQRYKQVIKDSKEK